MKEKGKLFTSLPAFRVNPFLDKVILGKRRETKKVTGDIKMTTADGTQVTVNVDDQNFTTTEVKMVDSEEFVKMFKETLRYVMDLSLTSVKVLAYVMENTHQGNDSIEYCVADCMKFTGFKSKQSVYDGLYELAQKNFVARAKKRGFLYINPTFLFNGDRVTLVKRFQKRVNNARKAAGI